MATTLPVDIELNYKLPLSWQYDKIEFLGLPHLKDNRPLRLGEIFIPLRFDLVPSAPRFSTIADDEQTFFLPKLLKEHKRLVVLGDPGCGKSTLIKQVTHSFSTSSPPNWTKHFGNLLPIPVILRDYRSQVGQWETYEDLLRSFIGKLDKDIRDFITVEWLAGYLAKGQAIVLLDGIDEIGSAEARRHLRDEVVLPLVEKFPDSYFILTSRIIGYEEAPFESFAMARTDEDEEDQIILSGKLIPGTVRRGAFRPRIVGSSPSFSRCYVSPFNDEDIEQFITRWYAARESDADLRREGVESLKRSLEQNDRVRRLAGNPSLLTLIALIHRITANLPSGRVKLYDKITEAYLETIDSYKFGGLGLYPASLEEMKRWLTRVGWEMQSRRDAEEESDLLVSRSEIQSWLQSAIAEKRESAEAEAAAFLDYIARRSGLLIPRGVDSSGNDLFSFVHLTFQEYFAALHLRALAWDFDKIVRHVSANLTKRHWHETFLLVFEMLADMPGSGDKLVNLLVVKAKRRDRREAAAKIFSELLLDDENGLSLSGQQQAAEFARKAICEGVGFDNFGDNWILTKLQQLPAERRSQWLEKPLVEQLKSAKSETLTTDYFLVGDEIVTDWLQQIEDHLVGKCASEPWRPNQIATLPLIGVGKPKLIEWSVGRLPVHYWLAPIFNFWRPIRTVTIDGYKVEVGAISTAELNLTLVCDANLRSAKHQLLAQSALALVACSSQIVKAVVMARSLDRYLDRYLDGYLARSLDRSLARSLDRSLAQNLFAATVSVPLQASTIKSGSLLQKSVAAEWLAFQPERKDERLNTIAELQPFLKAGDDWTQLLAISNLITLSAGTPELVAERNRLCDKAMKQPNEFTFPAELREATQDKEWFDLKEIIAIIFLHEPGDPFLKPEWFDPQREESKFFLSPPREFFALAAEVLDPEGETELAKWRDGKLQNKESSTA